MWFDQLPPGQSWSSLWHDYVRCTDCRGIRLLDSNCPACDAPPHSITGPEEITLPDGRHIALPSRTFMGAEGRYEDYVFLALMEREWKRQSEPTLQSSFTSIMSERAGIVLLFWTYFETRMNRLISLGARDLPDAVREDLFKRYDNVTAHMRSLYLILFGATYQGDLVAVGAGSIAGHLDRVKDARNKFVHGDPSAITDSLVEAVVRTLKDEHEAWIAVFNRRIASMKPTSE
jgi:hypothetical protein